MIIFIIDQDYFIIFVKKIVEDNQSEIFTLLKAAHVEVKTKKFFLIIEAYILISHVNEQPETHQHV